MKILYYSTPSFADADIPLLKNFYEKGNEVIYVLFISEAYKKATIIDIDTIYKYDGVFPSDIYPELRWIREYLGFDFYVFNINSKKTYFPLKPVLKFRKFYNSIKPDVINFIGNPGIISTYLLFLLKGNKILTVHDPIPHSGELNKNTERLRQIGFKLADKIILLNNKQTQQFCEKYHIHINRIFYSSLGIMDWMATVQTSPMEITKYVLFFGRISKYKGIKYLLEAAIQVKRSIPDFKLIIAGSGDFDFDISEYKKLDYIKFINRYISVKELIKLIRYSYFTICPYTDATQSGVIGSSLAMKKPIIATSVGNLATQVHHNKTGIIIPPKDVSAIVASIVKLYDNPELVNQLSENIETENLHGANSWDRITDNYLLAYSS